LKLSPQSTRPLAERSPGPNLGGRANFDEPRRALIEKLKTNGLDHVIFVDTDVSKELTSVATFPLTVEQKAALRNYRLWNPANQANSARQS
jgi:hypothetical protein